MTGGVAPVGRRCVVGAVVVRAVLATVVYRLLVVELFLVCG